MISDTGTLWQTPEQHTHAHKAVSVANQQPALKFQSLLAACEGTTRGIVAFGCYFLEWGHDDVKQVHIFRVMQQV